VHKQQYISPWQAREQELFFIEKGPQTPCDRSGVPQGYPSNGVTHGAFQAIGAPQDWVTPTAIVNPTQGVTQPWGTPMG
jgi:hypothetical protein